MLTKRICMETTTVGFFGLCYTGAPKMLRDISCGCISFAHPPPSNNMSLYSCFSLLLLLLLCVAAQNPLKRGSKRQKPNANDLLKRIIIPTCNESHEEPFLFTCYSMPLQSFFLMKSKLIYHSHLMFHVIFAPLRKRGTRLIIIVSFFKFTKSRLKMSLFIFRIFSQVDRVITILYINMI